MSVIMSPRFLQVGAVQIDSPVVLAPMAGITNRAYRTLCREYGSTDPDKPNGLYVSEMVTSRALIERNAETLDMVTFGSSENPRSVQLYGVPQASMPGCGVCYRRFFSL
jgi:tRNA-dihydrouridine synthase